MTTFSRDTVLRPGMFGDGAAADSRRVEFDYCNESLLMEGVQPDVLFIGDSITHLWEVQAYFGGTGAILTNRGIGGDITTNVRRRYAADALQLQPGLIVMLIGTNDLGWEPSQLDARLTEVVCANIHAMAQDTAAMGIPLALCSILPIWGPSWLDDAEFQRTKNVQITEINARLRAIAELTGAIYVDYHRAFATPDHQLIHEMADDGVHPHAAGYSIMARVLRETLAEREIAL